MKELTEEQRLARKEYMKRWRAENREHRKAYKRARRESENAINRRWKQKNKERVKEYTEKWRLENAEHIRNYSKEYSEKYPNKSREYNKKNPGKMNARTAKYLANKKQATPPWLTTDHFKEIESFYIEAKRLEELDGIKRDVDHIIPLQGKKVRGLHVPWNLQILTKKENKMKSNKLLEEKDG